MTNGEVTEETISFKAFLETVPPNARRKVSGLRVSGGPTGTSKYIATPDLILHCDSPTCGGVRTFETKTRVAAYNESIDCFLNYTCRNCHRSFKDFSIACHFSDDGDLVTKYGEVPAFGPPTPARALSLIGGDRDLFLKGRRCEVQGLGIGAFTYYRRVIESQRNRVFDEIIKVLEAVDPANAVIEDLRSAKTEQQFTKSIEAIKHALPSSLLINGQNPLRLLHSALSEGLHALTDEECLRLASAARLVLFEFSERLAQALRDDADLAKAVSLLAKPKS